MNKKLIAASIVIVLAITATASVYIINNNKDTQINTKETTQTIERTNDVVEYKGSEGKTALELLQIAATTEISGTGANAFVTSINGVDADLNSQYWSFKVNGELASVGAGSYITKDTDSIKWELTSF